MTKYGLRSAEDRAVSDCDHNDCHRGPQIIVTTQNWILGSDLSPSASVQGAPGSPAAETHIEVAFP